MSPRQPRQTRQKNPETRQKNPETRQKPIFLVWFGQTQTKTQTKIQTKPQTTQTNQTFRHMVDTRQEGVYAFGRTHLVWVTSPKNLAVNPHPRAVP
jgi:hypothetical protein